MSLNSYEAQLAEVQPANMLGVWLERRQELGWSERQIAEHLHEWRSTIHYWLHNNGTHKAHNNSAPLVPNNIYCMDCLDGLRQLPHDSVDLVFADPPYNIGVDYGNGDTSLDRHEATWVSFDAIGVPKWDGDDIFDHWLAGETTTYIAQKPRNVTLIVLTLFMVGPHLATGQQTGSPDRFIKVVVTLPPDFLFSYARHFTYFCDYFKCGIIAKSPTFPRLNNSL